MAKGNVFDQARNLRDKSKRAVRNIEKGTGPGTNHPSAPGGTSYHKKAKASSMAPNSKNKRKSYGRAFPETATEERKRKGRK